MILPTHRMTVKIHMNIEQTNREERKGDVKKTHHCEERSSLCPKRKVDKEMHGSSNAGHGLLRSSQ
jgi:hypothetical protein